MGVPEYPEHKKLKKVSDKSQVVGDFLAWCEEQGWELATFTDDSVCMSPIRFIPEAPKGTKNLLARYFNIDLVELEAEKVAMLDFQRERNAQNARYVAEMEGFKGDGMDGASDY